MWACLNTKQTFAVFVVGIVVASCAGCGTQTDNPTLQKLLVGTWENEDNYGATLSFDDSGTLTVHLAPIPLVRDECTVMYTYRVVDFSSSGTYVLETLTHEIGNCGEALAKQDAGDFGKEKLDVKDSNHIFLGSARLARR